MVIIQNSETASTGKDGVGMWTNTTIMQDNTKIHQMSKINPPDDPVIPLLKSARQLSSRTPTLSIRVQGPHICHSLNSAIKNSAF